MKQVFIFLTLFFFTGIVYAQFTDTAHLNQYLRDTLRDRRPDKINAAQLRKAFLGISAFLNPAILDTLTVSQAQSLAFSKKLVPGNLYYITGADQDLYGGTYIILGAVNPSRFSTDGLGYFYNPIYNSNTGHGVWMGRETPIVVSSSTDTFELNEPVITTEGATGNWINDQLLFTGDSNEIWEQGTNTTITGINSGASAEILIDVVPSYDSGFSVIWGGRAWTNKTGHRGWPESDYLLNAEDWEPVPYDETDFYLLVADPIKYDLQQDRIIGRREEAGDNEVYGSTNWLLENDQGVSYIKAFQWGNPYENLHGDETGAMRSQRIWNGFNNNINFTGRYQMGVEIKNKSIQNQIYFGPTAYQENVVLDNSSYQTNLFLLGTHQANLHFNNSNQANAVISSYSSQQNFSFINSAQQAFVLNGGSQANFYLWNYNWDRNGYELSSTDENDFFKFGQTQIQAPQIYTQVLSQSIHTTDASTTPVLLSDLNITLKAGKSYSFEYELFASSDLGSDSVRFGFNQPGPCYLLKANYSLTDQTAQTIQSVSVTGSSPGSLALSSNGPFRLRISGTVLLPDAGTFSISIWPKVAGIGTQRFWVEAGSFVKFTELDFNAP